MVKKMTNDRTGRGLWVYAWDEGVGRCVQYHMWDNSIMSLLEPWCLVKINRQEAVSKKVKLRIAWQRRETPRHYSLASDKGYGTPCCVKGVGRTVIGWTNMVAVIANNMWVYEEGGFLECHPEVNLRGQI